MDVSFYSAGNITSTPYPEKGSFYAVVILYLHVKLSRVIKSVRETDPLKEILHGSNDDFKMFWL